MIGITNNVPRNYQMDGEGYITITYICAQYCMLYIHMYILL